MRSIQGQDPILIKVPLLAGASINDGALIMPGVTADTDLGLFILATGAAADAIGTLRGKYTYSATNTSNLTGTQWVEINVELNDRYQPQEVEYDQTDTMAVASNVGTTLTITSLEDNIDLSWIYNVTKKQLSFLTASASGSATQKTAMGWSANDTCIKILRLAHQVAKLNTAADKIGTDAGAGSWTVMILENWFEDMSGGFAPTRLNPTLHDNLTLVSPRFWSKVLVRNTAGHTID